MSTAPEVRRPADDMLDSIRAQELQREPRPYRSVPGIIAAWRKRTGAVPSRAAPWPFSTIGGPVTHALVTTALGSGAGWLYGRYIHPLINPDVDKKKTGRTGAIIGGSTAALLNIPALAYSYSQHGLRGLNKMSEFRPGSGIFGPAPLPYHPFVNHGFSSWHAREDIAGDQHLAPWQRAKLLSAIPPRSGLITPSTVARGALGSAKGYAAAGLLGATLGTVFGMSRQTQRKLRTAGAVAGALRATGFI